MSISHSCLYSIFLVSSTPPPLILMVYSGLVDNIAELFEYQAFIFDYLFKPIAYDDQSSNTYTLVDIMIKLMTCFEVCL